MSGCAGLETTSDLMRQELVDALGGMIWQPGEHVGEPSLRVDIVELGSRDQGVDGSSPPTTFVGAGEGPVAAPDRDGTLTTEGGRSAQIMYSPNGYMSVVSMPGGCKLTAKSSGGPDLNAATPRSAPRPPTAWSATPGATR